MGEKRDTAQFQNRGVPLFSSLFSSVDEIESRLNRRIELRGRGRPRKH